MNFPSMPGGRLGPQLARPFQAENGSVRAITMDPKLEAQLTQGVRQSANEVALIIEPRLARHVIDSLSKFIQQMLAGGASTGSPVRAGTCGWPSAGSLKTHSTTWPCCPTRRFLHACRCKTRP